MSKCIMGFQANDCHQRQVLITMFMVSDQHPISQANERNSKLINGGFNKWMEILAGKDLPTKLGKSKNVAMKYSESNGTVN